MGRQVPPGAPPCGPGADTTPEAEGRQGGARGELTVPSTARRTRRGRGRQGTETRSQVCAALSPRLRFSATASPQPKGGSRTASPRGVACCAGTTPASQGQGTSPCAPETGPDRLHGSLRSATTGVPASLRRVLLSSPSVCAEMGQRRVEEVARWRERKTLPRAGGGHAQSPGTLHPTGPRWHRLRRPRAPRSSGTVCIGHLLPRWRCVTNRTLAVSPTAASTADRPHQCAWRSDGLSWTCPCPQDPPAQAQLVWNGLSLFQVRWAQRSPTAHPRQAP